MPNSAHASKPRWTDLFVHRPMVAIVLCLVLMIIGVRASTSIPVLQYPTIESSRLAITTPYVGASAEVVQGFVTEPIERIASTIPGIDYVDSVSTAGMSRVSVWLKINEDSTAALAELSSRLEQIKFQLPERAEDPSVQVIRADRPFSAFYLNIKANNGMNKSELTDFLVRNITPELGSIPGIQDVNVIGGRLPAMRVWLDPTQMAATSVSPQDVRFALTRNNIIATIGKSENSSQQVDLLTNTSLKTVEDFENIVIRKEFQTLIRLKDIARIELGEEEGDVSPKLGKEPSIFLGIDAEPGANEIDIGNELYGVLDNLNETFSDSLTLSMGFDSTIYMRQAIKEIFMTLVETVLLVGIVVTLFMGSLRTALVPLVTIPISLLGAIAAMWFMGFSLNIITVLAIVLSVGLVVDDAIVVVENVARKMRSGMGRTQAALESSRQLLTPIIAMTITLATVYAPIGFLSGLTGVLFKEFAFSLAVAVLISGAVALTLSPIMSAYVCPPGGKEGRFTIKVNNGLSRLEGMYKRLLEKTLNNNAQILFIAVFFTALIIPLFLFSQQELAPTEDQNTIRFIIAAAPESSEQYTTEKVSEMAEITMELPGARRLWQVMRPEGGFSGQLFHPFDERPFSVQELFWQVFNQVSMVAPLQIIPTLPAPLPTAGNFSVELMVLSNDSPEEMLKYAEQLKAVAQSSGKFITADNNLRIDKQQARFIIDRDRVADLGMTLEDVSSQIGLLMSGNYINRFDLGGRAYKVIPQIEGLDRLDPDQLMNLEIQTPDGNMIPLSGVASLEKRAAPRALNKFEQKNSFQVFGIVTPNTTKEQGLAFLEKKAKEILPANYSINYSGESRQIRQEGNTLFAVLGIAVLFVFLVLAVQFNSFRDPIVILAGSVPLALCAAMVITFLGLTTLNIYSQIGLITLVGLVSKNAILIVEFAKQLQLIGHSKYEAIKEAATMRLRPVLMTTGATVMGHFPLVLVTGAGAEARNSIGIILVGGMLIGTAFTLLVLPTLYLLLASRHEKGEWGADEEAYEGLSEGIVQT